MELENTLVYGPVKSRRFGWDLGINLLPLDRKLCAFDCVYCQYGFTPRLSNSRYEFPSIGMLIPALEHHLARCEERSVSVTHATLSGNGEPTMHPDFAGVIKALVEWRDRKERNIKLALLTTGYRCSDSKVLQAMELLDESIVKLDSAVPEKWMLINRPLVPFSFPEFLQTLRHVRKLTLQTMFIRGWNDGEDDIKAWKRAIEQIKPVAVQIYTISRHPALASLKPVTQKFLNDLVKQYSSAEVPIQAF